MSVWKSMADMEQDFMNYSDFNDYTGFEPAPPKSIAEYRAKTSHNLRPGIFDNPFDDVAILVNGRGSFENPQVIRPGQTTIIRGLEKDEVDIRKRLRQLYGLGYRNEVIENRYRKKDEDEEKFTDAEVPDIALTSKAKRSEANSPADPGSTSTEEDSSGIENPTIFNSALSSSSRESPISSTDNNYDSYEITYSLEKSSSSQIKDKNNTNKSKSEGEGLDGFYVIPARRKKTKKKFSKFMQSP